MSYSVFADIKADGTAIEGQPNYRQLAGVDVSKFIECYNFSEHVQRTYGANSRVGGTTSRRKIDPIVIEKKVDKSSGFLMNAMVEQAHIEATFHFFRPGRTGVGTTGEVDEEEEFLEIKIQEGLISDITVREPFERGKESVEIISIVYNNFEYNYKGNTTQGGPASVVYAGRFDRDE